MTKGRLVPPRSSPRWADGHHRQQGRQEAPRAVEQARPLEQSLCPRLACDPGLGTGSLGAVPSIDWRCEHTAQCTLRGLNKNCEGGGLGPCRHQAFPHRLRVRTPHASSVAGVSPPPPGSTALPVRSMNASRAPTDPSGN